MMLSRQKIAIALDILRRKWPGESSLRTALLSDSHEIELSDYIRAPSPGSETPSGILNGASSIVKPISDLDLFFERLYSYYCEKGLLCIIIKWIAELLSLAFIICFSAFFLLYVDWKGLSNAKCGMDAVTSGIKPCDLSKEALNKHPLTPFTLTKAVIIGYLGVFSMYWIFSFLRFFSQLKETLNIRQFYYNRLHVTDNDMQTMPWASILEKVVQLQSTEKLCVVKDLSAHDIVMRLMRKDNYLIGMLNKGVLSFPISQWVPGAGPTVKFGPTGTRRLILTRTLEWTLNWCILQSMFDRNFCVRRDFICSPKTLKKNLIAVGVAMLVLSPFIVIFMLVYLFLKHAEQFYNHPSTALSRRWSNLSKWILREFNEVLAVRYGVCLLVLDSIRVSTLVLSTEAEDNMTKYSVDHLFKHRINRSVVHASEYLKQFPSPIVSIIAKFISFVSGGFAAILIIIAFMEESLLEGHIFGRNLFWYAAVFGTITAISRAAVTDDCVVLDPQGAMSILLQHTHYMPKRWRGKENSDIVRLEFETLFQYTGMMLLEEMASIFLTPYLLIFVVPERVDEILQFIAEFTVDVEGVGHVCSFSAFDFRNHGNVMYGAPHNSDRVQRSSQGKMEKSFLSFQSSYSSWEPNSQGKQFLSKLKTFREQKLQGQEIIPPYLPLRMQQWDPNLQGNDDLNNIFLREAYHSSPERSYQFGSLWLSDSSQKNYLNILELYYTSRSHLATETETDAPSNSFKFSESTRNLWIPHMVAHNEAAIQYENGEQVFDDNRSQSYLEASSSAPLFHRSVLHHVNASHHPSRSHWWARSNVQGKNGETRLLEPPNNFRRNADNYHDGRHIVEAEEDDLDWMKHPNRLSLRSFYMDNLEGQQFNLPFDDIYSGHSDSDRSVPDPSHLVS